MISKFFGLDLESRVAKDIPKFRRATTAIIYERDKIIARTPYLRDSIEEISLVFSKHISLDLQSLQRHFTSFCYCATFLGMSLSKRGLNSETLSTTYLVAICDRMHQEFIHFNVFSEIDPDDMLGGLLLRVAGYTRKSSDLGWDYYLVGYDDYEDKIEDALNILYYMYFLEHQKSDDESVLAQKFQKGRMNLTETSLVVGSPRFIKSSELNESIKKLSAILSNFSETLDSIIKY